MQKTKTKTKTAVAVALVTFAVVSTVAAATLLTIKRGGIRTTLRDAHNFVTKRDKSVTQPETPASPATTATATQAAPASDDKSGCDHVLDRNCNGIYDKLGPDGQDCAQVEKTGTDFSPSTCFYSMSAPASQPENGTPTGTTSGNVTYLPLPLNCDSSPPWVSTSNGRFYYTFTVPKGTYYSLAFNAQPRISGSWSEEIIAEKDYNITDNDFNRIIAPATITTGLTAAKSSLMGKDGGTTTEPGGGFYYVLKKGGDRTGGNVTIMNSPDGVIKTVNGKLILSRAVKFTAILEVVGAPSGSQHRLRYCAVPAPPQ